MRAMMAWPHGRHRGGLVGRGRWIRRPCRAAGGRGHLPAPVAQHGFGQQAIHEVILDQQQVASFRRHGLRGGRWACRGPFRRTQRQGQGKRKRTAGAGLAAHAQRAAHKPHQAFGNTQAQTRAAVLTVGAGGGLGEGLENLVQHFRRDAHAGIAHREAQPDRAGGLRSPGGARHQAAAEPHLPGFGELDGITHQIQ